MIRAQRYAEWHYFGGHALLLRKVEKFLVRHDMPATKFGRLATHDPRFVLDLRNGREPRALTEARVETFMQNWSGEEAHVE